ncbi:hypothetical protein [Nocardia carnea]|uniref:hypothetical protein n=1 Tax=Nocardia carnea TaxID=37328 RepID=UPI0024584913|nr:hypothetical protein [Nocardia carnea]
MTFINVDPATYYEAATIVNQAATAFFTAYAQQLKGLETTNAMAGSAGPGRDWAVSCIAGHETAPIGLKFTEAGADPQFKAAVEKAVGDLRAKHPDAEIHLEWA